MKLSKVLRIFAITALVGGVTAGIGLADVVETKNGARLIGKVLAVDGSVVTLSTDYAGTIKVKQSDVVNISTEAPLNVRLASGTVLKGTVTGSGAGAIAIAGPDGSINTTVDKVAATWAPDATDPAILALTRAWTYEAAVDVTGKTGNSEQLGTQFSFRATMTDPTDKLQFYTAYNRQVSDHVKSADAFDAGVDYQANISPKTLWYVRDEAGFDRLKLIEFSNLAAAGLGYHVINRPTIQTLDIRAGLAHRYESYKTDPKSGTRADSVNSAGLDFGLEHHYQFATASLVNRLSIDPAFENFSNFLVKHESYLELPISDPLWKVRIGVSNDYNSKPPKNTERLDTTYFTRLVLNWK
jgi:small nuclear ribonucleoprotein (snRNP)-like protein